MKSVISPSTKLPKKIKKIKEKAVFTLNDCWLYAPDIESIKKYLSMFHTVGIILVYYVFCTEKVIKNEKDILCNY